MEQETPWTGKWKYVLVVVGIMLVAGGLAYTKISSVHAKSVQSSQSSQLGQFKATTPVAVLDTSDVPSASQNSTGDQVGDASSSTTVSGQVVASKNGTKYFPTGCKAPKAIKEENKITFTTPAEAEKAGYTLAKNCVKKSK